MNRKAATIVAASFALFGVTACTPLPASIDQIISVEPSEAPQPRSTPVVNASADCATFQIAVSGLELGDVVQVGEGSQPPYGVVFGSGVDWQFTVNVAAGTVSTSLPVGLYESTHDYTAVVDVNDHRYFEQIVDCHTIGA